MAGPDEAVPRLGQPRDADFRRGRREVAGRVGRSDGVGRPRARRSRAVDEAPDARPSSGRSPRRRGRSGSPSRGRRHAPPSRRSSRCATVATVVVTAPRRARPDRVVRNRVFASSWSSSMSYTPGPAELDGRDRRASGRQRGGQLGPLLAVEPHLDERVARRRRAPGGRATGGSRAGRARGGRRRRARPTSRCRSRSAARSAARRFAPREAIRNFRRAYRRVVAPGSAIRPWAPFRSRSACVEASHRRPAAGEKRRRDAALLNDSRNTIGVSTAAPADSGETLPAASRARTV